MPEDWEVYGQIVASEYRQLVMRVLLKRPQTPTQIANEINKHQSYVSKTLTELEEMELIECLNPGAKKGRLYGLTDYGEEIFRKMIDEGYIDSD